MLIDSHTGKRSRTSTLLIIIFFVAGTTVCLMLLEALVEWGLG